MPGHARSSTECVGFRPDQKDSNRLGYNIVYGLGIVCDSQPIVGAGGRVLVGAVASSAWGSSGPVDGRPGWALGWGLWGGGGPKAKG